MPPTTQTFSYDADGNLTNDSVWFHTWDGENRLVQMTNFTTVPSAARKKLVFGYDYMGRRITKKVYPWASTDYSSTPETDLKFVYDGWNLIAELNATNNASVRSYVWGQDISGTMDEGGGIGGLLLTTDHSASTHHFFAYDGNGNVVALVKTADSTITARYEHSAFGEMIRRSGSVASANAFGFSSKFGDHETGLLNYGLRYYSPALGRFINRDPIEEEGGLNLLAFVANAPLNAIDPLGANTLIEEETVAGAGAEIGGGGGSQAITILNRVREMVDTFNDMQQFTYDVMSVAYGDSDDLYQDLLMMSASALVGAAIPGRSDFEMHHIFPQRKDLAAKFRAAGIDIKEWQVKLNTRTHIEIHQGGKRGGNWNADWEAFLDVGDGPRRTADEMFDFAAELMQKYGVNASQLR